MATHERASYRFAPRPSRGILLGLGPSELLVIAASLAAAVIVVQVTGRIGFGLVPVAGAAAYVWLPIDGRRIHEWLGPVASHGGRLLGRRCRWSATVPLVGARDEGGAPPPPELAGFRILTGEDNGREVGIVVSGDRRTYTALLAVIGSEFALLEPAEQERRIAAWGDVLAGCARERSAIRRVQWVERAVPDPGTDQARFLAQHLAADPGSAPVRSYLELVHGAGVASTRHEAYVALQIAPQAKRGKGEGRHEVGVREAVAELRLVAARLASADLVVSGPLSPGEVAGAVRHALDPTSHELFAARSVRGEGGSPAPGNATPLATEVTWSHYRSDGAYHATYWVAEWPRLEVHADWLAPLLMLRSGGIRAVSLMMEPTPPGVALRRVERDALGHEVDTHQRTRWGFAVTARRRQEHQGVLERERELVAGYVDLRFVGTVSVTAAEPELLALACRDVEQAALQSHLDLRRLYGQQAEAFVSTLPLCRGVAQRRFGS